MRIRWRGVARVAAVVAVGLIALHLLPGLLRAPEPPPLAADVGLPKAEPVEREPIETSIEPPPLAHPDRKTKRRTKGRSKRDRPKAMPNAPAATAVIGTRRHHRKAKEATKPSPHHGVAVESAPPPIPESIPAPPPEPPPAVVPAPPPPPGDGSEEFAPH